MAGKHDKVLRALEAVRAEFGGRASAHKCALIRQLAAVKFDDAEQLLRFHEVLCFVRAYPDDAATLALVERTLAKFGKRKDLAAMRGEFWNTGVAGTDLWFKFFWPTAKWLAEHWPAQIRIDWEDFANRDRVVDLLPLLLPYSESPAFDEVSYSSQTWLDVLRGQKETDATFLVRRFEKLPLDEFGREALYDALDVAIGLAPGDTTPSRTRDRRDGATIHYQTGPLDRKRPNLGESTYEAPLSVRAVDADEGRALIDLARRAMVTRTRDLDGFCNGDPHDVRLIDCGGGLEFALIGAVPSRRLVIESSYAMLTLKSGMPIGYVLISAVFGSAAIAYNVFDTFRGGEAAWVFGRVLAVAHHVFGVDSFSIDPYQLGDGNLEGLRSGAFWFYHKLGFRPGDAKVQKLARREVQAMQRDESYRSDLATLERLVVGHVHFHLGDARDDVLGKVFLGHIGLSVSEYLARRFGSDRETGVATCAREAAELCGVDLDGLESPAALLWWERWSPVLLAIPRVRTWPEADLHAAGQVILTKASRHESDYVRALDAHVRLRRGLLALAAER